jgi:large conductance mechanosensitive channel
MLKEFKEFALRGSVVDLAVGVVIGGAFGAIVTSFTNDIIMPPIGLLLGRVNFTNLFLSLNGVHYASLDEAKKAGAPTLNYGVFINSIINFLIIAFVIFLFVRQINRLHREPEAAAPTTRECPYCLQPVPFRATRCQHCTSQLTAA